MFFRRKKDKKIQDIEQIPMEQPFSGQDEGKEELYEEERKNPDGYETNRLDMMNPDDRREQDDFNAEGEEMSDIPEEVNEDISDFPEDDDEDISDFPEDDEEEMSDFSEEDENDEVFSEEEFSDLMDDEDLPEQSENEATRISDSSDEAASSEEDGKKKKKRKKKKEKKNRKFSLKGMSRKKKIGIGFLGLLCVAAVAYLVIFGVPGMGSGNKVYVQKVSEIMNLGSGNGGQNRYAGVVESQETWNIKQNADKTVKEIYVKEGDSVKIGDKLFAYDNDEAKLNLEQAKLELERMQSELKSGESEIANLEKEKKSASSSDQLEYTIQIQSQKATNKKKEYEIKSQQAKIKSLEKATKNSVVKSEMDGVVKKINQSTSDTTDESSMDMDDGDSIFMSILATGDYRIKATINEQNAWTIEEGKEVIVHSRVDESATWKGTINKIDTDNPDQSTSSSDYYSESSNDGTTSSSKYPFYIKLESSEGLILGQHVYIELDEGQDEKKEGVWLDSYYIIQEEDGSYVWMEGLGNRLEKKKITLGEYNEELDQYQITEGLSKDDYIAFPEDSLEAGMKTTRNAEEASGEDEEEGTDDFEGDTGIEPETDLMDEDEIDGASEQLEGLDGIDNTIEGEDGEIWEDEPTNEDGSVGRRDVQTEVLL